MDLRALLETIAAAAIAAVMFFSGRCSGEEDFKRAQSGNEAGTIENAVKGADTPSNPSAAQE